MNNSRTHSGKSYFETVLISGLIIIFFVSMVLMYYNMLLSEKQANIIKDGERSAQKTVDSVELTLDLNSNFVTFSGYTIENMLEAGRSEEQIKSFLAAQSTAIMNSLNKNSTGLYGYIDGKFYAANNWVPPADFDAKARPWYINAMDGHGQMALLEPYQDMDTGTYNLAMGKTLSDGESVISVDVSLENIQETTEAAVSTGNADIVMILNEKGTVIAHSDKDEVGMDYSTEKDSLGGLIYDKISGLGEDEDYVQLRFGGKNYIAYVIPMIDNWKCISVLDTTASYKSIVMLFIVTLVLVVAIVFIISYIMISSGRRGLAAEAATAENMEKEDFLSEKAAEIRKEVRRLSRSEEKAMKALAKQVGDIAEEMQKLSGKEADDSGTGRGGFLPL